MAIKRYKTTKKIVWLVSIFSLPMLVCYATPAKAAGIHCYDGNEHTIGSNTHITTSNNSDAGMRAQNPGTVISADDNITVETTGNNSHGAYSNISGTIFLGTSANIKTSGYKTLGVFANGSSNITIGGSATITTLGDKAYAVYANDNSNIKIADSAAITTSGKHAYGILASKHASADIGKSADIYMTGEASYGVYAHNFSNMTIGSSAKITTLGDNAHGGSVKVQSSMDIGGSAKIKTSGAHSYGAFATKDSDMTIGNNVQITTSGTNAYGAVANINSSLKVADSATINTSGKQAHAVYTAENSDIKIGSDAKIMTSGDYALGTYAQFQSSMTIGRFADIHTSGEYAHGAVAHEYASMDIGNSATIKTSGDGAHGAWALDNSSMYTGNSINIVTSGNDAYGAYAALSADMTIAASANIAATGGNSHAIYARDNSSIDLADGRISALGSGSYAAYSTSGSQITGTGRFDISGNMRADGTGGTDKAVIDFTLENGSRFLGNTSYASNDVNTELNLTLNGAGTVWMPDENSELTNLHMDGAAVDMSQAFGITVTTVNLGKSDNDKGIFRMDSKIVDEAADKLIITGQAKGNYILDVTNSGADSVDGTEITDLVQLEKDQNAIFELDHTVECGGFQFGLGYRIGGSPDEKIWHLYSSGRASTSGSGAVNSFAGSYLMAYAETNTLIQRMGDLRQSPYDSGLWFRIHGGKFESNAKSYVRGFDMKYGGVQIGYDLKIENGWNGALYTGLMFGYSKGDLDYSREGSGKVDSKTVGLYGVYVMPDGFYIDAVLKYQWMSNDFDVIDTAGTLVRGKDANTGGLGFSVEAGKRIPFSRSRKSGWYAEPQIQLSYQRQSGGYFKANNGLRIGVEPFTSLLGRVGLLVGYETERTNFYGKISRVKEFDGDLTLRANGVPIAESFDDSWWVYGIGFTSRVNERNSMYVDIERTSGGGFSQPWRLNAGWRMEF